MSNNIFRNSNSRGGRGGWSGCSGRDGSKQKFGLKETLRKEVHRRKQEGIVFIKKKRHERVQSETQWQRYRKVLAIILRR